MAGGSFVADFEQACTWLAEYWGETAGVWGDGVRQRFEGDYWEPLARANSVYLGQLRELATVLEQVRAEVP